MTRLTPVDSTHATLALGPVLIDFVKGEGSTYGAALGDADLALDALAEAALNQCPPLLQGLRLRELAVEVDEQLSISRWSVGVSNPVGSTAGDLRAFLAIDWENNALSSVVALLDATGEVSTTGPDGVSATARIVRNPLTFAALAQGLGQPGASSMLPEALAATALHRLSAGVYVKQGEVTLEGEGRMLGGDVDLSLRYRWGAAGATPSLAISMSTDAEPLTLRGWVERLSPSVNAELLAVLPLGEVTLAARMLSFDTLGPSFAIRGQVGAGEGAASISLDLSQQDGRATLRAAYEALDEGSAQAVSVSAAIGALISGHAGSLQQLQALSAGEGPLRVILDAAVSTLSLELERESSEGGTAKLEAVLTTEILFLEAKFGVALSISKAETASLRITLRGEKDEGLSLPKLAKALRLELGLPADKLPSPALTSIELSIGTTHPQLSLGATVIQGFAVGPDSPPPYALSSALTLARSAEGSVELEASLDAGEGKATLRSLLRDLHLSALDGLPLPDLALTQAGITLRSGPPRELALNLSVTLTLGDLLRGLLPGVVIPREVPTEIGLDALSLSLTGEDVELSGAIALSSRQTVDLGGAAVSLAKLSFSLRRVSGELSCEIEISGSPGVELVADTLRCDRYSLKIKYSREQDAKSPDWSISGELATTVFLTREVRLAASYAREQGAHELKLTGEFSTTEGTFLAIGELAQLDPRRINLGVRQKKSGERSWDFSCSADFTLFSPSDKAVKLLHIQDGELSASAGEGSTKLSFKAENAVLRPLRWIRIDSDALSLGLEEACFEKKKSGWECAVRCFAALDRSARDGLIQALATAETRSTWEALLPGREEEVRIGGALSVSGAGLQLGLTNNVAVYVPIPVIVDGALKVLPEDLDAQAAICLQKLDLNIGKEVSASGKLAVRAPKKLNNLFGEVHGEPKLQFIRSEEDLALSFTLDSKKGASLTVESVPLQLEGSGLLTPEIEGDKTWTRFTLGALSFRFGVFPEGDKQFVNVDFGDFGALRFVVPKLSFDAGSFTASGEFEVLRNLRIPTRALGDLLRQAQLARAAELLPPYLQPLDIHILQPNAQGQKVLDADRFISEFGRIAAVFFGPGAAQSFEPLRPIARALAEGFNRLPQSFVGYLDVTLPKHLRFDVALTPASGPGVKIDIEARQNPIRLLLPPMGVGLLCGVTVRKLSFGELLGGTLFLLGADMDIDLFDLPVLAASVMLPQHISQQFTSTPEIHRRLLIDDLLCLIVYQAGVPIPIPIWFDSVGATYHGFEGLQTGLVVNNLAAGLTVGSMLRGAVGLIGQLKRFFGEAAYLLPPTLFADNQLNLGFNSKPCFLELPSYLGGARVGSKLPTEEALFTLSADTLLVPALNFFKTGKLGPFLGAVPLRYRKGSFSSKELQLGPIGVSAEWVLATLGELGEHGAPTELISLIKGTDDAIVLYASGEIEIGDSFRGASTRCHLGVLSDPQRGIVTCYGLRAELPALVSLDLGGSLALVLDGAARSAALAMAGRLHLSLLGQRIIDAEVALGLSFTGRSGSLVYGAPTPISLFGGLFEMTGAEDAAVGPQGGLVVRDGALTTLWFDGAVSLLGLRSATRLLLDNGRLSLDMRAGLGSIVSADLHCEMSAEKLEFTSNLRVDLNFTRTIADWIRALPPEQGLFLGWLLWIPLPLVPVAVDLHDLRIGLVRQPDGRWRFGASSHLSLTVADQELRVDGFSLDLTVSASNLAGGLLHVLVLELPRYFAEHLWEILLKVFNDTAKIFDFVVRVLSAPKRETGLGWEYIGGNGVDIGGVDGDGTAWFVSNLPVPGGYRVYSCSAGFFGGQPFVATAAGCTNLSAGGPPGQRQVWLVNSFNDIYYLDGAGSWTHLPTGKAEDIGVGADGSIWITGTDGGAYRWTGERWQSDGWVSDVVKGNRVAVEPNGCPWVVTGSGAVWRRGTSGQWAKLRDPGSAYDVGVGAGGQVFIVSRQAQGSGYTLEFWTGSAWTSFEAQALRVAVTPDGRPITATGVGTIQGVWRATLPIPAVELFEQPNYQGKRRSIVIGRYDAAQLGEWGLGAVRSLRVPENFRVTLSPDEAGPVQVFAADTPELGADIRVSSLAVAASVASDCLLAGSSLAPGERLRSRNGAWELVYKPAGNLVLYHKEATIYDSQNIYRGGGRLSLDEGGTLSAFARDGVLEWRQGPAAPTFGARLTLYDDGRLELSADHVVYWTLSHGAQRSDALRAGQKLAPGQWLLSPNGAYKLTYQTNGNLVVYRRKDDFVPWHSHTDHTIAGRAGLREDGRLVIEAVDGPGRVLSPEVPDATLSLRDDGEILIANPEFERWSSSRGALPPKGPVAWRKVPGGGSRIACGREGAVWIVGGNPVGNNDFGLWRWNGGGWDPMPGGGLRVAVGPNDRPWVTNSATQVWRGVGPGWSSFEQLPGNGGEISVGADGTVWLIGTDSCLYRWDEESHSWLGNGFACARVAVGATGRPWALDAAGELWRGVGPTWQTMERMNAGGSAVAVGPDTVWLIGRDGGVWRLYDTHWEAVGGDGVDIAVGGAAWRINASGEIFTG